MLGVFAEFERALIVERVRAGMQRAKREGKHLGRSALLDRVRRKVQNHPELSGREVAKVAGCGEAAVRRLRAPALAQHPPPTMGERARGSACVRATPPPVRRALSPVETPAADIS